MRNEKNISSLGYRELRRFLLAVWAANNQWYWTEVGGVEYPNETDIRLIGVGIHMKKAQTFYGIEVYDHEGELVCWGEFSFPCHCQKDNILTVSHQFIAEAPMASISRAETV